MDDPSVVTAGLRPAGEGRGCRSLGAAPCYPVREIFFVFEGSGWRHPIAPHQSNLLSNGE